MIRVRPAGERGRTEWGWLDSRHTFSFGEYFDREHQGFRALRVINDDRVAPGGGSGRFQRIDRKEDKDELIGRPGGRALAAAAV
jgi:hypothetical protein